MTARQVRHLLLPVQDQAVHQASFMTIQRVELDKFFILLKTEPIKQLLQKDRCYNHVDNYLLAMVFVYFKRSGLSLAEYSMENFWLCLYLAHDQEEDEEELKWELFSWALGDNWRNTYPKFLVEKDKLWKKMNCKSVVSRRQCEQIMVISSSSYAWDRVRGEEHGGAVRRAEREFVGAGTGATPQCVRCRGKGEKRKEYFIITEEMDVEQEEVYNDDRDSEMETDGEIELFPEE